MAVLVPLSKPNGKTPKQLQQELTDTVEGLSECMESSSLPERLFADAAHVKSLKRGVYLDGYYVDESPSLPELDAMLARLLLERRLPSQQP